MLTRIAIILLCLSAVYLFLRHLQQKKLNAENKQFLLGKNKFYLIVSLALLGLLIMLFPRLSQLRERFRNNR